ncbi:MAG: murein biosynthesis integral membrane protein MurJ [Candidatus Aminicenantes bacterium]|nr:murein biosynthesis integral membrane protein MurJ [Candidatus Aminicenantes bacterium]
MEQNNKELLSGQNEESAENKALVRSTGSVAAPTLLSRILGAVRDILQAKFLGTGTAADAFTLAFILPNLLRRLTAEGSMTAAFIPVFTSIKKEENQQKLWKFANLFFFDLTLLMAAVMVAGILLSPLLIQVVAPKFEAVPGKMDLTITLTRIMFPYIFFISLAALAMAILNSFKKFFVPAFTPVLFNLSIITLALIFAKGMEQPAFIFALGVVLGGILQLAFQIPFLWKQGMRFTPGISFSHPAVRKVGKLMVPGIFGISIHQINFLISRVMATSLEEGSVSSLYYSSRIHELTLGLFSIALATALLPTFSEQAAGNDISGLKRTFEFSMKLIILVTMPAMVGLLVMNKEIIQVIFQYGQFDFQSTAVTSLCLFYFAFSLPFISGVKVLAPAFYSFKDTKTPVIVAFIAMVIYISLALVLMGPLRVGGIALSFSVSSIINFFLLFILLEKKIGDLRKKALLVSSGRSLLFSLVMGGAVWLFIQRFDLLEFSIFLRVAILSAAVLIGICVYFAGHSFFNKDEFAVIKQHFKRKVSQDSQR